MTYLWIKIKNNEIKQILEYMTPLIDNSWECDYHISYVISLLDKQAQLQCSTANVGKSTSWLVG